MLYIGKNKSNNFPFEKLLPCTSCTASWVFSWVSWTTVEAACVASAACSKKINYYPAKKLTS